MSNPQFKLLDANLTQPSDFYVAVTTSDGTDLPQGLCRAIYVGGDGNVSVLPPDNATPVVFTGLVAGTILPIRTRRIRATSTTATNLVALY